MKLPAAIIPGIVFVYCAVLLPSQAAAQANKAQLDACYAIANINDKVACYDNLARPQAPVAATPAQPAAPARVTTPTVVTAPAPQAAKVESFGQEARVEASDKGEETLVDKVATISRVEPNKMQITLANGQVWKQSVGKTFQLDENDTVRITKSPWGSSFRLARDGAPGFIQVTRLR